MFSVASIMKGKGTVTKGVAAFSPADIAGLQLWLDAQTLAGADASAVATWADQSGNSRDATQATGASRPLLKTGILNGKQVVRFDGTDDYLATASFARPVDFTLFCVYRFASATNQGFGSVIAQNGDGEYQFRRAFTVDSFEFDGFPGSIQPTNDQDVWRVMSGTLDGADGELFLSGVSQGTATSAGALTPSDLAVIIGARGDLNAATFLGGDIAEIVLYNAVLSAGDRQAVEDYLMEKYAIS